MRIGSLLLVVGMAAATPSAATGVADDFESYAPGAFPAPTWLDAGAFMPLPPVATLPSATVELTTDAFGNLTRALAMSAQVALVSGIYAPVSLSSFYTLAADIRVDRFSDAASVPPEDFAIQLTFASLVDNLYIAPQAGIYAASQSQDWRLFLIDSGYLDLPLLPVTLGQWVRLRLDVQQTTGAWRATIDDIASGVRLVDQNGLFPSWGPGSGQWDAVAFIEGEGSPSTVSNLAWVDNVNVTTRPVPAPAPLILLGSGAAALAALRRGRAPGA